MEKAKIRVFDDSDLYEIEVNDNGETIVLDKSDIDLPFKINDAFIEVEKLIKNNARQAKVIEKKEAKEHGFITTKDEAYRQLIKKSYKEMRRIMDGALGAGACNKIFGDRNSPDMFSRLMEQLTPHFAKLGWSDSKLKNTIEEKYSEKDDDVMD